MLSKEQIDKYKAFSGDICPFCGYCDISKGTLDGQETSVRGMCGCNKCKKQWQEVFELTELHEIGV